MILQSLQDSHHTATPLDDVSSSAANRQARAVAPGGHCSTLRNGFSGGGMRPPSSEWTWVVDKHGLDGRWSPVVARLFTTCCESVAHLYAYIGLSVGGNSKAAELV